TLPQQGLVEDNQIEQLLEEFYQQYQTWMVPQQTRARDKLSKIIKEQPMHLLDPTIAHTREWPVGSRNDIQSSTHRISSAFELEELKTTSRKYGICQNIGHN
ncbi:8438_t:CDS:1, partial [Racocetra persica]